jgi:hypothetical protein
MFIYQSNREEVYCCYKSLSLEAADERSLETRDEKSPESSIFKILELFPI